jgi:BlaI family transcriptional regulator, penicillinase repressor
MIGRASATLELEAMSGNPRKAAAQPQPTAGELAILSVLWRRGPSTVREVRDDLAAGPQATDPPGYTTVLKLLQIMTDKGLVCRDERARAHVYRAAAAAEQTQRRLVRDLVERAFGGSAARLVLQALAAKPATRAEIIEIRALLDEAERRHGG